MSELMGSSLSKNNDQRGYSIDIENEIWLSRVEEVSLKFTIEMVTTLRRITTNSK